MRYGVSISAALHVAILILAVVGLPSLLSPDREDTVPVAVEMISEKELAEQPSPKAAPPIPEPAKPEPPEKAEAPPAPPPPPPPTPPQQAIRIPPPEPLAKPEPKPEPPKPVAKPPPPEPEPDPVPKPQAKPKPPPEPEPPQVATKTPAEPPVPRPKTKPAPPPDELESLLKNLAKEKRKQDKVKEAAPAPKVAARTETPPKRSALQEQLAAQRLARMIMEQVVPCWSIPIGAKDVQAITVDIRIRMNPDGTYATLPQIRNTKRIASDTAFQVLAESAIRALRDPKCTPLKLPYEDYDDWKDIVFGFTPPN